SVLPWPMGGRVFWALLLGIPSLPLFASSCLMRCLKIHFSVAGRGCSRNSSAFAPMLSFLTTNDSVVILDNMKAQLLLDHKTVARNGAILQQKIWKVPESILPTSHGFKYRLVYIRNG